MKRVVLNTLSAVAVCLTLSQAMGAEEKGGSDEQTIKQLEQEWADALVKRDQAAIANRVEANQAREAVKEMGTNALPTLIRMLGRGNRS